MPRTTSTFVPKYRKHRASGQAVVTLCGVDHYLGPTLDLTTPRLVSWSTTGLLGSGLPTGGIQLALLRTILPSSNWPLGTFVSPRPTKTQHTGRERAVFIGPQGQEILLKYLARDPEMHCFRPVESEAKRRARAHEERKTSLSCGNRPGTNRKRRPQKKPGEKFDSRSYHRAVRTACDKAFPHPAMKIKSSKRTTEEVWH